MPTTIRRLPELAPRDADETAFAYGARALRFLLETRCTAVLDDDTLELAEHAAQYAVASHDISAPALAALNEARHAIAATFKYRRTDRAAEASKVPAPAPQQKPGPKRVPVVRPRPVLPSSGAEARF